MARNTSSIGRVEGLEVLRLLDKGRTNQDIPKELVVYHRNGQALRDKSVRKLIVGNRTQAVMRARELDLVQ